MNRYVKVALLSATLLRAQTVINGGRTIQGPWDASGASSTKPVRMGPSLPGACSSGEMFFLSGVAPGQNLYLCTGTNTWSLAGASSWTVLGPKTIGPGANQLPAPSTCSGCVTVVTDATDCGTLTAGGSTVCLVRSGGAAWAALGGAPIANPYTALHSGAAFYTNPEPCFAAAIGYNEFTAAASSQQIAIGTVPAHWQPRAIQVEETTPIACSSCATNMTAWSISVGTSGSSTLQTWYLPSAYIVGSTTNWSTASGAMPASLSAHTLYALLSVTNSAPGNLGNGSATNLTAGVLTVRACGVVLQ